MIDEITTMSSSEEHVPKHDTVIDYLANNDYKFEVLEYDSKKYPTVDSLIKEMDLPANSVVRTVMLQDNRDIVMAILPETHLLDFAGLCCILERNLEILEYKDLAKYFDTINVNAFAPVPGYYGLSAVVYEGLFSEEQVYFLSGEEDLLICMPQKDFFRLHENSWKGKFSESLITLLEIEGKYSSISNIVDKFTPRRMNKRIKETYELPILPAIGKEILKLRVDPNADSVALSKIVAKDPSLSAQLISWACSPYYGYPGKIQSIEDAIIKVLGFDLVMNIALGIAVGNVMKIPHSGSLGLRNYWQNAIYCATLIESLVDKMSFENRPSKGLAYLSGLLYNIGFLLLGQLFQPQYFLLNKFLQLNKHIPISILEGYTMNISHTDIGVWLIESWNMPREILIAVKEHHNANYDEEECKYAHLVLLANTLLKRKSIGFCGDVSISQKTLDILKLTQEDVDEVYEGFSARIEDLESIINLLAE